MIEDSLTKAAMGSGVAMYAAAISTLALIISVVTATVQVRKALSEGVKLKLHAMSEVKTLDQLVTFVAVTVTNRGTAATTLTYLLLRDYRTDADIRRKRAYFTAAAGALAVPYLLKPGEIWQGRIEHNARLKQMLAAGRLHIGVVSSHREGDILLRLKPSRGPATDPWAWIRRPVGTPPKPSQ